MKTVLIADAGSTKVDWVLISEDGETLAHTGTPGINALMAEPEQIREYFGKVRGNLGENNLPDSIYYYGAGCATPEICDKIGNELRNIWKEATEIEVASDLTGAARSLHGRNPGIACILGTGSNSGLYDGRNITHNIPSLGFILGDEGSGAALGKRLVADAFKGHLPKPIRDQFMKMYELSLANILEYTYLRPAANRFLASLVPFIRDHIWNPYLYSLVLEEFTAFLKRNVAMYPGARNLPISFVGSIAWHFSDILRDAADRQGLKVSEIIKSPLEGLKAYHSSSI